jgi:hypothetical protein
VLETVAFTRGALAQLGERVDTTSRPTAHTPNAPA